MMKFTMSSTDEYERLVKFFVENQLEFDGDEEVDTDIIKCWKITQGDDYQGERTYRTGIQVD